MLWAFALLGCWPDKEPGGSPVDSAGDSPGGHSADPPDSADSADSAVEVCTVTAWAGWPTPRVAGMPLTAKVVAGDLNGDGLVDLVGCRERLFWSLNPGSDWIEDGAWVGAWQRSEELGGFCTDLELVDLDADGLPEVVAVLDEVAALVAYPFDGAAFGAGVTLATGLRDLATVAVGDFDGDGTMDLAAAPWVLWGEGSWAYTQADPPCAGSWERAFGALPLVEDGRSVLRCSAGWFLADPGRAWAQRPSDPSCVGEPSDQGPTRVGDLDGDGAADALLGGVELCLGDGTGALAWGGRLFEPSDTSWVSALADADGDGWLDAVVHDESAGQADLRLFTGGATGLAEAGALYLPHSLHQEGGALWQDLDGDGAADLLAWDGHSDAGYLFRPEGGGFAGPGVWEPEGLADGGATAADLDGDGVPELVAVGVSAAWVGWSDGARGYTWTGPHALPERHRVYAVHSAGDLDGDGAEELVLPYPGPWVLDWDGVGFVATALAVGGGSPRVWSPDLDGDGEAELVLENVGYARGDLDGDPELEDPEQILIFGLGGGVELWLDHVSAVGMGVALALHAGSDLDGDGQQDLVLVDAAGVRVWSGHSGGLAPAVSSEVAWASGASVLEGRRGLGAADADGDGDLDLWLALPGEDAVQVLENDGAGGFTLGPRWTAPAEMVDDPALLLERLAGDTPSGWVDEPDQGWAPSWRPVDGAYAALPLATPNLGSPGTALDLDGDGAADLLGVMDGRVSVTWGTAELLEVACD